MIISHVTTITLEVPEQREKLRIRRQFSTPDSTLQQTLNGLQGQRRPTQSGNLNREQGQGLNNNRGSGISGNYGMGFGNQGVGSNVFSNQVQGSGNRDSSSNGFGGPGQGFGNQGLGSNSLNSQSQGFNQGPDFNRLSSQSQQLGNQAVSGGNQGRIDWTTQRSPFNIISNENSIDEQTTICIRSCSAINNYNPVCGDDNITYQNSQKLRCAQQCNRSK